MTVLLGTLERDLADLRQMVSVLDDALTSRARRPGLDDADGGRQVTHVSRPTEALALDEARAVLHAELQNGARWLPYAIAAVRGVTASMDRALAEWEGEDTA
ncbi:hypothetical protein ACIP88_05210 [Streptomyces uncialis]|uniref:DUF7169 domain-containing protein n=1 Tax=Streptomyces uncialis TaxID=1048205 RepID=UPI0037FC1A61